MKNLLKKHADKVRFGAVGIANTALDWSIFFTLVAIGIAPLFGNFVSTSVALTFSFYANKTFAFKDQSKTTKKHFMSFVVITLIGLWIIQPIIIEGFNMALGSWFTQSQPVLWLVSVIGPWFKARYLVLFIGKGWATAASLVWNYVLYRKFVFARND
ncbi:GtrA family protein [Candidatus Saccharibacteria bacterium]|nr:GtrA family protein [Candidatus Saccharibacteria bacterium]